MGSCTEPKIPPISELINGWSRFLSPSPPHSSLINQTPKRCSPLSLFLPSTESALALSFRHYNQPVVPQHLLALPFMLAPRSASLLSPRALHTIPPASLLPRELPNDSHSSPKSKSGAHRPSSTWVMATLSQAQQPWDCNCDTIYLDPMRASGKRGLSGCFVSLEILAFCRGCYSNPTEFLGTVPAFQRLLHCWIL